MTVMIDQTNDVLLAVTSAVEVLETNHLTNAGVGYGLFQLYVNQGSLMHRSNLSWNGVVECDACLMEGSSKEYAAASGQSLIICVILILR